MEAPDATAAEPDPSRLVTSAPPPPTPVTVEKQGRFGVVPFVVPAYQPETSGLLGAAAVVVYQYDKPSVRRESRLLVAGAVSLKKQYSIIAQPDLWLLRDALHVSGTLSASHFPDTFFGIGNDTRAADAEPYTPNFFEGELSVQPRIVNRLYLGPSIRAQWTDLDEVQAGGLLERARIEGARGGLVTQAGLSAVFDARDETLYPRKGQFVQAYVRFARHEIGSEYDFTAGSIDARQYLTTYARHVLAFQALLELRGGAPPFFQLGRLGGESTMRGYFQGRFRDRNYTALQAEYRVPVVWRLGAVAFVSAGRVAHTPGDLTEVSGVRFAGGGGLRLAPFADVPINIRLDVAYGNEPSFYLHVGEAF